MSNQERQQTLNKYIKTLETSAAESKQREEQFQKDMEAMQQQLDSIGEQARVAVEQRDLLLSSVENAAHDNQLLLLTELASLEMYYAIASETRGEEEGSGSLSIAQ